MEHRTARHPRAVEDLPRERVVEQARRAGFKEGAGRSVAQAFCLVGGLILIAAGVLGFFFGGSEFSTGSNVSGEEFLGFEVNGWHNVMHIATGGFLLLMAATARSAITGALLFGFAYIGVMIWGFADGNDVADVIPVNLADNILHAVLAGAALLAAIVAGGLLAGSRRDERRLTTAR